MNKITNASKWMQEGITQARRCRDAFEETKIRALNAGVLFAKARQEVGEGEFSIFVARYEDRQETTRTTVYRYIQFSEGVLEWAKAEHPELVNKPEALLKAAYKVVLQSPKSFVALMRQLGEMRKFGEYDAVKYATRKLGNGNTAQIEFKFDELLAPLDHLCHFGEDNYTFIYPAGVDESQFIDEAIAKGKAVVARLEAIKQHGRIIEA